MATDKPGRNLSAREIEQHIKLRSEQHRLLAVNPNHFGNLVDVDLAPALSIVTETAFEQLTCIGFNPASDTLEATVVVKRSSGYGGDLCSNGSPEWVRFHLSYDEGATWEDVGLGSFTAHDIPDSQDCSGQSTKPLVYTVAFPVTDPHRKRCSTPVLPLVRAILSWQVQPPAGQPDWLPVWGNRLDGRIQIRPRPSIFQDVTDLLDLDVVKLPPWYKDVLPLAIPEPDPAPFSLEQAATLARKGKVPAHRFAAPALAEAQAAGFQSQEGLLATSKAFAALDLDLSSILDLWDKDAGDTTYEQLDCLGLDYHRDLLVSTLRIKKPSGFSGPPCSAGSTEYVAFWVDYGNTCQWTYVGTSQVVVHDYDPMPDDGLHYWVGVPAGTAEYARSCKEPRIGKVRAVLSWNTPPSTTDPHAIPRWGNAIETHVEIPPRRRPPTKGPEIRALGRIPVESIDIAGTGLTVSGATFIEFGSPADSLGRPCPFGGAVTFHAYANDAFAAAGHRYRAVWRPAGSSGTGTPVTDPFVTGFFPVVTRTPDPDGFHDYLSTALNPMGQLAAWRTKGVVVDGVYEVRLEMADAGGNPLGRTAWHRIRVDNTEPDADITFLSATSCNKATPGDLVSGTFVATDPFFGHFALVTKPLSLAPPSPTHTPALTTSPTSSGTWSLQTDGTWAQCGYVVELWVYDRSIVNSVPWQQNVGYDDIGFCLGL